VVNKRAASAMQALTVEEVGDALRAVELAVPRALGRQRGAEDVLQLEVVPRPLRVVCCRASVGGERRQASSSGNLHLEGNASVVFGFLFWFLLFCDGRRRTLAQAQIS
jgi:hypothetical protein